MRREDLDTAVPPRARPTRDRAAAAARLAGAPAGEDAVAQRMRDAARRARSLVPVSPAVSGAAALAVAPDPGRLPRPHEPERPRHLRLVPPGLTPAQRTRRARALVMATVGAAAMIGLALVYFHVVLAQRQFALDHLQSQVHQAQSTYQERRLEVARLGSPAQIIARAEGQLGMVQPTSVSYLTPPASLPGAAPSTAKQPLGRIGPAVQPPAKAPTGDANWPAIKQQLAGIP